MTNEENTARTSVELPEELLISFAKFLAPEIVKFYQSDEGKEYYAQWLKKHPEYLKYTCCPVQFSNVPGGIFVNSILKG